MRIGLCVVGGRVEMEGKATLPDCSAQTAIDWNDARTRLLEEGEPGYKRFWGYSGGNKMDRAGRARLLMR
jgi:hypothetical protein